MCLLLLLCVGVDNQHLKFILKAVKGNMLHFNLTLYYIHTYSQTTVCMYCGIYFKLVYNILKFCIVVYNHMFNLYIQCILSCVCVFFCMFLSI